MRPTTPVFYRFESIGKPAFTEAEEVTPIPVADVFKRLVGWLSKAHMGKRMDIRIATTITELNYKPATAVTSGAAADEDIDRLVADWDAQWDAQESSDSDEPTGEP